jgi:Tfp pilus assembly protein PilW
MRTSLRTRAVTGTTLVETMLSLAITTIAVGAIYVGSITLQKSFRAAQHYADAQAGQLRVLDYVAMDLRRAVDWTASGNELRMKIPNFYDATDEAHPTPRDPRVSANGEVYYGASPADITEVRYYSLERTDKSGRKISDVYRAVTSGGNTRSTVLVKGVEEFKPVYEQSNSNQQVVRTKISFPPMFRPFIESGNVYKDGTATFATTMVRNKR